VLDVAIVVVGALRFGVDERALGQGVKLQRESFPRSWLLDARTRRAALVPAMRIDRTRTGSRRAIGQSAPKRVLLHARACARVCIVDVKECGRRRERE
jgi:hypothetical protein